MIKFLSKILGGNKSEKDVKKIEPLVALINQFSTQYNSLSNDALRNKTTEFKNRIQAHLSAIDTEIAAKQNEAETLSESDIHSKDTLYKEADELKKTKTYKNLR